MNQLRKGVAFIILNSVLLLLLTACLGGSETAEPQNYIFGSDTSLAVGSEANLICSAACYDRAQCGKNPEGQDVVLLATFGAAVTGHDRTELSTTPVSINSTQMRTVARRINGEQYPIEFYQVTLPSQELAWVGGWCIHQ